MDEEGFFGSWSSSKSSASLCFCGLPNFPCIVVLEEEKVIEQERQALSNLKGSRNI